MVTLIGDDLEDPGVQITTTRLGPSTAVTVDYVWFTVYGYIWDFGPMNTKE